MKKRAEAVRAVVGVAALGIAARSPSGPLPEQTADAIYSGGPIVTVNDAQPRAGALAVLAVGTKARLRRRPHARARPRGAGGRANLLAPPDGEVETVDDLVAKLQAFAKTPTSRGPAGSSAPATTTSCWAGTRTATISTRSRPSSP
jgi:hypothetical protein